MHKHASNPSDTYPSFIPTVFTRHNRFLHAFIQDHQAWFCAQDHLRQWLSNEVVPMLRNAQTTSPENLPSLSALNWAGVSVPLLHYQHHAWIKWRDMPELMQVQRPLPIAGTR